MTRITAGILDAKSASATISDTVDSLATTSPDASIKLLGDFNHRRLQNTLPNYHQVVDCATRGNNFMDRCYCSIRDAYEVNVRHVAALMCFSEVGYADNTTNTGPTKTTGATTNGPTTTVDPTATTAINLTTTGPKTTTGNMTTAFSDMTATASNMTTAFTNMSTTASNMTTAFTNMPTTASNMTITGPITTASNMTTIGPTTTAGNMTTAFSDITTTASNMTTTFSNMTTAVSNMTTSESTTASDMTTAVSNMTTESGTTSTTTSVTSGGTEAPEARWQVKDKNGKLCMIMYFDGTITDVALLSSSVTGDFPDVPLGDYYICGHFNYSFGYFQLNLTKPSLQPFVQKTKGGDSLGQPYVCGPGHSVSDSDSDGDIDIGDIDIGDIDIGDIIGIIAGVIMSIIVGTGVVEYVFRWGRYDGTVGLGDVTLAKLMVTSAASMERKQKRLRLDPPDLEI
ncbi:uncharacterized protein LOC115922473 [Strongylocentrotus purpuratus]|uniref:Uncharacterized protein n=1 Tax=Strongylocentrotus purpuratus TaxID=7668 RepID=A0A7M7NIS3_STRPU|nr:uncharacterized protein LOC115922473 [Strongylocentrotus purpuratus]